MASSARAFLIDAARRLAEEARQQALPSIPSETLRRAARGVVDPVRPGHSSVHIPHYWAIYVHDGRSPFRLPPGRFMVWFKDAQKDPRNRGGRPKRLAQVRKLRLSKGEFHRLARSGQIIVATAIHKRTPATPFFSNQRGMAGFTIRAGKVVQIEWRKFLRRELKGLGFGKPIQFKP